MPTAPSLVIPPASGSTPDTPTAIVPLPTGTPIAPGGITPAPDVSVSAPGTVVGAPDAMPDVPASIVEVATGTPAAPLPASAGPIERVYPAGPPGLSAYEVAVENGFVGSVEEWLASLPGAASVRYDTAQSLTTEQKTQGRANIDAAASSHTHSGADADQWVEGSMHNAMTASLGNADWLFVPEADPLRVITAIDSVLGTGWQSGGGGGLDPTDPRSWERPYMQNKLLLENSTAIAYYYTPDVGAEVGAMTDSYAGFPDGVKFIDFTNLNDSLNGNYGTFPIPSSIQAVYWNGTGSAFSLVLQTLNMCPWLGYLTGKTLDFAGGTYGPTANTYLITDELQNVVEVLMSNGNTVTFPEANLLNDAWHEVPTWPSVLICINAVTYEEVYITRGDGITDGLGDPNQIFCGPTDYESTNEFTMVPTDLEFPRRNNSSYGFYHVKTGSAPPQLYVAAKPDFGITTPV